MAKEGGYFLRLSLNEKEKEDLDRLVEKMESLIGMDVSMSWVLRTLVKIGLCEEQNYGVAEKELMRQLYASIGSTGIPGQYGM
jgi:hypothetical protein